MRYVEKATKKSRHFVENADFLEKDEKAREKRGEIFKNHLTRRLRCGIITEQMKQNSRSHPAAVGAQRLICSPLGVLWRAECLLRAIFYFAGLAPGIGGTLLLATQRIC